MRPAPREKWLYFAPPDSPEPLAAMMTSEYTAWLKERDAERRRVDRRRIIERDGLVCAICNDLVDPEDVHIDHVVSLYRGGDSSDDNLQVTHSQCNLRKSRG